MASHSNSCRSCGADIVWAITKGGKRMPVDAEPNPAGNVELTVGRSDSIPWATVHSQPPGMFDDWVDRAHMPHFATCPDGESWRKS